MVGFFIFLYLAMLTHFSAMLFAGAVGAYSLWRTGERSTLAAHRRHLDRRTGGALGLLGFLWFVQISKLKAGASAQHMQVLLANSYFHWGTDHLLGFVFARTFGVLQYTFGQLAVGDIAVVLFIAGIVLLFVGNEGAGCKRPSPAQLGFFLLLPFVINAASAIAGLYPYGGTRHSAFLIPFSIAGVSLVIAKLARGRLFPAMGTALLIVAICQAFGAPHRPYMRREDQRRSNMFQAMDAIRQGVSSDDVVFVDFQTSFLLRFYLCPEISFTGLPPAAFRTFPCGGHRAISLGPETNVLTANSFPRRWDEMVRTHDLKPGQTVWIFQAGWDIGLARELQERVPKFRDLRAESFGRNISLFRLSVGQETTTGP